MMLKKYKNYIFAIGISLTVIFLYVILNQDFRLHNSVLINDLGSQYTSLIQYIKNCYLGNDSFLYSFSKGIGGNMASTIAYYLTSPLNLICLLFDNINVGIMIGIICRFCLANITMYIYLKDKYDKKHCLLFSTMYAFSGYMILYYFNVMWLDVIIITPIVLKYIDKLVDDKFSIILPITLALSLILNYYISYMLFVFVVIYAIYKILLKYDIKTENKEMFKTFGWLVLSFVFAFLLSAWIILPTVLDMKQNMFRFSISGYIWNVDFSNIWMIIARLFVGAYDVSTAFSFSESNIYFSVLGLVLLIKYFLNKSISKKEKILSFIVILIFVFSVVFACLNLVWHGFSFPNGYNYRFSFVFSLFFIILAYKQYNCNQKLSLNTMLTIIFFFLVICLYIMGNYTYLPDSSIILTIVFLILYLLLLNTDKFKSLLFIVFFLEVIINFNVTFATGQKFKYEDIQYKYRGQVCDEIKSLEGNYRVSMHTLVSSDDGLLCNVKDLGVTLTTNNKLYYEFMHRIGYSVTYSTITKNQYAGPFIDSILGVNKLLRMNENYEIYYNLLDIADYSTKEYLLVLYSHVNNNALSLGYVINGDEVLYDDNPFENQNRLAKSMSGLDLNIFEPVELKQIDDLLYEYSTDKEYFYVYNYFPVPINMEEYISIYVDDFRVDALNSFHKGMARVKNANYGKSILKIEMEDEKYRQYVNPLVYTFNYDNYQQIMNQLQMNQMNVSYFEKNKIIGDIKLDEPSKVMISVPYEKGWNIKVNGKKVDYDKAYNAFVSLNLDKGDNHIKMTFIPPGFIIGTILSITGVVGLVFIRGRRKCKRT